MGEYQEVFYADKISIQNKRYNEGGAKIKAAHLPKYFSHKLQAQYFVSHFSNNNKENGDQRYAVTL